MNPYDPPTEPSEKNKPSSQSTTPISANFTGRPLLVFAFLLIGGSLAVASVTMHEALSATAAAFAVLVCIGLAIFIARGTTGRQK